MAELSPDPEACGGAAPQGQPMSDEAIELLRRERFQRRLRRVLTVMQEERIDWRGVPYVSPDGRIAVRVVPVEMNQP